MGINVSILNDLEHYKVKGGIEQITNVRIPAWDMVLQPGETFQRRSKQILTGRTFNSRYCAMCLP